MIRGVFLCVGVLVVTCSAAVRWGADDNPAESKRHPELVPFFPPLGNLDLCLRWPFAGLIRPDEPADRAGPEPLSPDEQQRLDDVLQAWERRSQSIERYRCTFKRWDYDPVFGPRDTFRTYSEGVIKYAAPDKGIFRVDKTLEYTRPAIGDKHVFVPRQDRLEHWLCDGRWLYEHDPKHQLVIQRELPVQLRAPAVAKGAVPFLLGADAERIRQRYWLRLLPLPEGVQGECWLEAYPKSRREQVCFQKVHVIIDSSDMLPKAIVIFDKNFDARTNPARQTFTFENREVNWSDAEGTFDREFDEPKLPDGWKKVVETSGESAS